MKAKKVVKIDKNKKVTVKKTASKIHKIEEPEEAQQTTNTTENTMSDQSAQQQTSESTESAKSPGAEQAKASSEASEIKRVPNSAEIKRIADTAYSFHGYEVPKQEAHKASSTLENILGIVKSAAPIALLSIATVAVLKEVFDDKK